MRIFWGRVEKDGRGFRGTILDKGVLFTQTVRFKAICKDLELIMFFECNTV